MLGPSRREASWTSVHTSSMELAFDVHYFLPAVPPPTSPVACRGFTVAVDNTGAATGKLLLKPTLSSFPPRLESAKDLRKVGLLAKSSLAVLVAAGVVKGRRVGSVSFCGGSSSGCLDEAVAIGSIFGAQGFEVYAHVTEGMQELLC